MSERSAKDLSRKLDRVSGRALPSVLAFVSADLLTTSLPFGWSVLSIGTGRTRIIHNLGLNVPERLIIHPTAIVEADDDVFANVKNMTSTTFDIQTVNSAGAFVACAFNFTGQFILS